MLTTSHIAATLIVSKVLGLPQLEVLTAIAGGVALDLDHLVVNKKWLSDVKNFLHYGQITHGEVKQHSWLQEPLFGLLAGSAIGLAISSLAPGVRWWIFPFFQAFHIAMDSLMRYEHQPLAPLSRRKYLGWIRSNTIRELVVSLLLLVGIAALP